MKLIDYILLALVAAAVFFAVRHIRRRRRTGCSGCCASCAQGCAYERERAKPCKMS